MSDPFFTVKTCARCNKSLQGGRIISRFNADAICLDCAAREREHPDYARATEAGLSAIRSGNRDFRGIGLPSDLCSQKGVNQ